MSFNGFNTIIPIAPTIPGSVKFKDLSVGDSSSDITVARINGNITVGSLTVPGGLYLSNNSLSNLSLPINPTDATSKEYVDAVAIGLNILEPVDVSSVGPLVLSGLQTIDGYTTNPGDRILVQNQVNEVENGIYIASIGIWSRSTDLPNGSSASRATVQVLHGMTEGGNTYVCVTPPPTDIVGIDPLMWVLFISTAIKAGAGLSKVENVLNVNVDNIGIQINGSNELFIPNGGISNANLQNSTINVIAGSGIAGGGLLPLGSTSMISVDFTVVRTTGAQTMSGPKTFTDEILLQNPSSPSNVLNLSASNLTTSYNFIFPPTAGLIGQILSTNGVGVLSWITPTGGNVIGPPSSTNNAIALYSGITGNLIKNSGVTIDSGGNTTGINNLTTTGDLIANTFTNGSISIIGSTISGLMLPVNPNDAVNKQYVDSLSPGLTWKDPVIVSTTTNIVLAGLQLLDGYFTLAGDGVLVLAQTNGAQNGIYVASTGSWGRRPDLTTGDAAAGTVVWVEQGVTQGQTAFVCTNVQGSDIVGVNALNWLQFSGSGLILAGAGLSKVGNTLNVNVDNSTISIVSNALQVSALGITSAQIANNTIQNGKLINSSLSILPGSGLMGGGTVSLGGSTTLSVDSTVIRTTGAQSMSGPKTFTDSIILQNPFSPSNAITLLGTNLSSSWNFIFPPNAGTLNQVLTTDGSGTLSWSTVSSSTAPGLPAQSLQFNSNPAGTFTGSSNLTYNQGTSTITLNGNIDLTALNSTINFTGNAGTITGLAIPVNSQDAANKSYVDSAISSAPGLPFTSIQFNNSGLLGGSANLLWNQGTSTISLNGTLNNSGTTNATSVNTGSIITAGGIGVAKDVYIGGKCFSHDFFTTSDERLKHEIEHINQKDLKKLDNINGYSYFLNDDDDLKYGFLANELEKCGLENLTQTVDNYKRISYQSFIPLLLEKIKSLEKRLALLEN
jgi:hypothetical protein